MKGFNKLWESSDGEIVCHIQNYDKNIEGSTAGNEITFIRDEFIFAVENRSGENTVQVTFNYGQKSWSCGCNNFFEKVAYLPVGEILNSWDYMRRQDNNQTTNTIVLINVTWGSNSETVQLQYCNADPPSTVELPDRFITKNNSLTDYVAIRARETATVKIDGVPYTIQKNMGYTFHPSKVIETYDNICVIVKDNNCVDVKWSDPVLGMVKTYGFEPKGDSHESESSTVLNSGYKYNKTEKHSRRITLCQYMSYRDWNYCCGLAWADDVECLGDYWTVESMDGFESMNANGKQYINITLKSL